MTLHYIETGNPDGETIVFLHGAGMAGWSWHDVTTRLPQYRSIVVDLPGHGLSNHIQITSLQGMAQVTADFVADIAPKNKAHIVGLSLGGITAIEMMQHRPEVIESAIVSGANAIALPLMMRLMTQASKLLIKNDFFIRQNARMYQLDEEASQAYFISMKQLDMTTFNNILPEILSYEPAKNLREFNLDIPALFVAGAKEEAINVKSVSLLANSLNYSVGTVAPDLHHGWSGENPDLFANMVDQWVSSKEVADGLDIVVDKRSETQLA